MNCLSGETNNLNMHRVYLGVVEWAGSAIGLYEKLGFRELKSNELQWLQLQKTLI